MPDKCLAVNGHLSYMEIPTVDPDASATFYKAVFAWTIRRDQSGHFSFSDGTGYFIGRWVTGHKVSSDPGFLPFIYVDHIQETVDRIVAEGGAIVTPPYSEGNLLVAKFRDPSGNTVGIWQFV